MFGWASVTQRVHTGASGALASYPTDVSIRRRQARQAWISSDSLRQGQPSMSGICRSKMARSNGWDESRVVPSNSNASCAEAAG